MKKKVVLGVLIIVLVMLVGGILTLVCNRSEMEADDIPILELTEIQDEVEIEQEWELFGEEESVQQELPVEENDYENTTAYNDILISDVENSVANETINVSDNQVKEELIDIQLDTDNDGAEDYIEDYFGTDKAKEDTDGDGLSDFTELYALVLDPLKTDTDGNGVSDAQEDLDGDGLSNILEFQISASIMQTDTDEDGLSDYDECMVYGTSPIIEDTDADGVSDSRELEMGTNSLVPEETFYTIVTAEDEDMVEVSVETTLSGTQVETLTVEKYENDFFFPTNMPGYIGGAYDFSVDGEIGEATIKFKFDLNLLADATFEPVIYYFNEEKQELEELVTTVDGNVASAQVTHFSKYILLDKNEFEGVFEWKNAGGNIGYEEIEVVFVIDQFPSMQSYDYTNEIITIGCNLVDQFPDNCKFGIEKYVSYRATYTELRTDKKEVKKIIESKSPYTQLDDVPMYSAIQDAIELLDTSTDNKLKLVMVLCDDQATDTYNHSRTIKIANDNNIKIYIIKFNDYDIEYNKEYLKPLAYETGGKFYLASEFLQEEDLYTDINNEIDIEADRDGDGISDYNEDNLVMFNGVSIKLDKNNPDTDGDGLLDGEEVEKISYQYNENHTQVKISAKFLSNPTKEDTDWDEISDAEELIIGTSPIHMDTDGDDLFDGFEYQYGYDPLTVDNDGDGSSDYQEYLDGTDPYTYTKSWDEHVWDFIYGFVFGDFIAETDSLAVVSGQILSSFIPYIDIRDVAGNLKNGDWGFAGLSALGLIPAYGDAAKAAGKVGKFVIKNIDEVPKVVGLMEFVNKNLPDVAKLLGKSDEFVEAAKQLAKSDNIKLTRSQRKVLTETIENAGLSQYLIKTSNSLDLKEPVKIGAEVWENGPCKRGNLIDRFINKHDGTMGLGVNFPIADRVDNRILVSTKSIDLAAQSYQNPSKLKSLLNKYASDLDNIEAKYFNQEGILQWGNGIKLSIEHYDSKALEIVLPDTIITENTLAVLNEFKAAMEKNGMEVWYRITQ